MDIIQLAEFYQANEKVDGFGDTFRRRARILQSMWREERGYPCGTHRGRPLGSRLPMPWAEDNLANYITPTIRDVVREEVLCDDGSGRLFGRPRIFNDLLSSQPLCFNLFGELLRDLHMCSLVLRDLTDGRIERVTALRFEHSPGRGDEAYTGDGSAFDVYIEYVGPGGTSGFCGIEVKYHEDLRGTAAKHRERYEEIAGEMDCFEPAARAELRHMPLQQLWRDHLLAGSILGRDSFDDGFFVLLHPAANPYCADAARCYRRCITSENTFDAWTLEELTAAIRRHVGPGWIDLVADRYLDFGKLDAALVAKQGR